MDELKEWALAYADNGFAVFPLVPGAKSPRVAGGVHSASRDLKQIEQWWTEWPEANIGLAMGAANALIGIDHDLHQNADPAFIDKISTYKQQTPNGGFHFFFRYTGEIKNGKKIGLSSTIRSEGYYFVMPPSIFEGRPYSADVPLWKSEISDIPQWIIDLPEFSQGAKESSDTGWRHDDIRRFVCALTHLGKDYQEVFSRALKHRDRLPKAHEKSDSEVKNIVDWAFKNITPDKVEEIKQVGCSFVIEQCIDPKFLALQTQSHGQLFQISDSKEKIVTLIGNEEYVKMHVREEMSSLFGIVKKEEAVLNSALTKWKTKMGPLREEPASFAWFGEEVWSYKKLSCFPVLGPHPAWDMFLRRLSCPEEFQAFIWSCFELKCRSRQFLYLYGPHGEEGKSTVLNIIYRLFGSAAAAINNSFTKGEVSARWLPATLVGKRVVVWPDCKNPKFAMSEMLRNIVSGDPVPVERKGEDPFMATLRVRLLIASNTAPEITEEGANASRLLRVDVEPRTDSEAGWEDYLEEELPYFLYSCREAYRELCPDHAAIRIGEKAKDLINDSATANARYDAILEELSFGPELTCTAAQFQKLCSDARLDSQSQGHFKDHLRKKYKVQRVFDKKSKKHIYKGLSILAHVW